MLSKRAENVMRIMGQLDDFPDWMGVNVFADMDSQYIIIDINLAKKAGHLKGCGAKTIAEIVELHETLNEIWE